MGRPKNRKNKETRPWCDRILPRTAALLRAACPGMVSESDAAQVFARYGDWFDPRLIRLVELGDRDASQRLGHIVRGALDDGDAVFFDQMSCLAKHPRWRLDPDIDSDTLRDQVAYCYGHQYGPTGKTFPCIPHPGVSPTVRAVVRRLRAWFNVVVSSTRVRQIVTRDLKLPLG